MAKKMTAEHKAALGEGRKHSRAVRSYLEALEANKPKRGRKRTPASIQARLDTIEETIEQASVLDRLQMAQDRLDLQAELARLTSPEVDMSKLEAEFINSAAAYGESKGISYTAWREIGVEPRLLKAAGISR